jgi:hypothetical protein
MTESHYEWQKEQQKKIETIGVQHDPVERPDHYTFGGIETIDYLRAKLTPEEFAGFCRGNVLKYVSRATHKNGAEDLKKARWYLDRLIGSFMTGGDD